jgi:hypothetical protein
MELIPSLDIVYQDIIIYDGLECRQTSKAQNRRPLFDVELHEPHRAQILFLNFIKYYSSWLHINADKLLFKL